MNKFIDAPCRDCKDRKINCHSDCEKYQEYARKKKEFTELERKARTKH